MTTRLVGVTVDDELEGRRVSGVAAVDGRGSSNETGGGGFLSAVKFHAYAPTAESPSKLTKAVARTFRNTPRF